MISDISCRLLKLHNFIPLIDTEKYHIKKCNKCNIFKVNYKIYNINSNFKYNELPLNIINTLKRKDAGI